MSKMKKVTKNNMLRYIEMKKEYLTTKDKTLLQEIDRFTNEVINKDKIDSKLMVEDIALNTENVYIKANEAK